VQLLRAKSSGSDFRQVLKLEKDFRVCSVTVTVNNCFAFFVVLGKGPRTDSLHVTSAKAGPAIRIEDIACARLVKYGPNFQALAQFPTTAVQHRSSPQKLGWFTLITSAFREIVECLFAWHFKTDGFEGHIHDLTKF
jgi:hypothetical protein